MMKKTILIMALTCLISANLNAQEVFKEIFDSSNKALYDTREDVEVRKLALFKVDALTYLNTQILAEINDSTKKMEDDEIMKLIVRRDSQAYFMYDYINVFMKEYSRMSKQKDKDRVMKIFRDASINNPLYNDPDRQFVLAYFNREDFITQFSLDTNWVKAYAEAKNRLKEM